MRETYPTVRSRERSPLSSELERAVCPEGTPPQLAGEGLGVGLPSPELHDLERKVDSLAALVMAQNAVLEKMSRLMEEQRVSRTQETAIKRAIQARAKEIALREGLKGHYDPVAGEYMEPEKRLAEAIRHTLRELTAARACTTRL